jgi:hypothetical protein
MSNPVALHLIGVCVTLRVDFTWSACSAYLGVMKKAKLAFGPGIIVRGLAFR